MEIRVSSSMICGVLEFAAICTLNFILLLGMIWLPFQWQSILLHSTVIFTYLCPVKHLLNSVSLIVFSRDCSCITRMTLGLIFRVLHPSLPIKLISVLLFTGKFILLSSGFGILPIRIREKFSFG